MLLYFFDLLFPPRATERLVRSLGSDGLSGFLSPVIRSHGTAEVVVLLPYQETSVRACVVETKYHGNESAAGILGAALVSYLLEELADRNAYEQRAQVLVPIPLSNSRLRERGYNQAEVIARHAARTLPDVSVETGLIMRVRATLPQTTLDGEARRRNVRDAFGVARIPDPNVAYIVIDDVVTTGATIHEAVKALQEAGARDVRAIALSGKLF